MYVKDNAQDTGTKNKSTEADDAASLNPLVPVGFKEVTVTTGVISADSVQILSGLNEGDEVYIDQSADSGGMDAESMEGEMEYGGEAQGGGDAGGGAGGE